MDFDSICLPYVKIASWVVKKVEILPLGLGRGPYRVKWSLHSLFHPMHFTSLWHYSLHARPNRPLKISLIFSQFHCLNRLFFSPRGPAQPPPPPPLFFLSFWPKKLLASTCIFLSSERSEHVSRFSCKQYF